MKRGTNDYPPPCDPAWPACHVEDGGPTTAGENESEATRYTVSVYQVDEGQYVSEEPFDTRGTAEAYAEQLATTGHSRQLRGKVEIHIIATTTRIIRRKESTMAKKLLQVNFSCTEELARMIAEGAEEAGSTRRFLALVMQKAGYTVPATDLEEPRARRRFLRDLGR
jgi:hypothetical protein